MLFYRGLFLYLRLRYILYSLKIPIILHESSVQCYRVILRMDMLKNLTLSADENLIEKARKRAGQLNTTLNAEFRKWLKKYSSEKSIADNYSLIMEHLEYVQAGQRFSRDELNER